MIKNMERKNLTVGTAKQFAISIFDLIKGQADRDFRIFHAKAVAKTAQALAEGHREIDREALEMGAWLHDIGYVGGEENHAERGIEILEKEGFVVSDKVADCVLHHGTWGKPRTKEGKIIQMADKISFINPGILEIMMVDGKIDENELEFLEKMLGSAIGHLRDFEETGL